MSKERKGHKICFDKAQNIRDTVKYSIKLCKNVPETVVESLREDARTDADFHRDADEEFRCGYGPAVRKKA